MKTHIQIKESERLSCVIYLYMENHVLYPISELVVKFKQHNLCVPYSMVLKYMNIRNEVP